MDGVFSHEIIRAGSVVRLLGERDSLVAKAAALSMFPLSVLCDAAGAARKMGILVSAGAFSAAFFFLWWYWLLVIPWFAAVAGWLAGICGICFGVIELAS